MEKKTGGLFRIEQAAIKRRGKKSQTDEYAIHNRYYPPMVDFMRERADIMLSCSYPKMSPEPLRWRDAQGFPLLVPFSLDEPCFRIRADGWFPHLLPDGIRQHYADVVMLLQKMGTQGSRIAGRRPTRGEGLCIEARFEGIIPPETRQKILPLIQTWTLLRDRIYLLAEVEEWEAGLIKVDPLVIGCHRNGDLLLIDSFDVTPLEEYIAREFTA